MFLYSGFSTEGDMDKVLLVGPIAPATYFCLPEDFVTSAAAFLASSAASKFNLKKKSSM